MDISRRWFLGGALGVAAASVLPLGAGYDAVLYADGIHDDTDALQAMFEGKPVYVKSDQVVVAATKHDVKIIGARLRMTRTLDATCLARDGRKIHFDSCHFFIDEIPGDRVMFNLKRSNSSQHPIRSQKELERPAPPASDAI